MPEKLYVSKKDGKILWVDPELHNMVKGFALENRCSLVAATAVLLARGLATWKGADPNEIKLPHDPHLGEIVPLDNA
jgi:hypothetical protein